MKIQIDKKTGVFANFQIDEYVCDESVQITSYASDIDMKDVETNQAWKFKIVDGELQYDQEAIKTKLNNDIIRKRQARYQNETDPILLEIMYEEKANGKTNGDLDQLKQELKTKKEKIKTDLPKVV